MRKFAATDRQPAVRTALLVLTLLPLLFALPTFAESTATDAGETDAACMAQPLWQQEANTLDDVALRKIHGKGMAFFLAQPEIIPAVILWDESGKGRSVGTSQTIIRVNVSSATGNTR